MYAVPFPRGAGKWQISANEGTDPHWRRDGKEIIYLSADNKIMAAEIAEHGATLTVSKVQVLFQPTMVVVPGRSWDVSSDGQKVLIITPAVQKGMQPLTLVTNWPALLKRP